VFPKTIQKACVKSAQLNEEKYARIPDSVLCDAELSPAARCVYCALARHVYQGSTVNRGQRYLAAFVRMNIGTVNRALHALEERGHITIIGKGKARRLYHLTSPVFGRKQRAGVREVIGSPSGGRRLASVRMSTRK
jgi:DNA-binding MarR family transcriptional regulator